MVILRAISSICRASDPQHPPITFTLIFYEERLYARQRISLSFQLLPKRVPDEAENRQRGYELEAEPAWTFTSGRLEMVDVDRQVRFQPIPAEQRDNLGLVAHCPDRLADLVAEGLERLSRRPQVDDLEPSHLGHPSERW